MIDEDAVVSCVGLDQDLSSDFTPLRVGNKPKLSTDFIKKQTNEKTHRITFSCDS